MVMMPGAGLPIRPRGTGRSRSTAAIKIAQAAAAPPAPSHVACFVLLLLSLLSPPPGVDAYTTGPSTSASAAAAWIPRSPNQHVRRKLSGATGMVLSTGLSLSTSSTMRRGPLSLASSSLSLSSLSSLSSTRRRGSLFPGLFVSVNGEFEGDDGGGTDDAENAAKFSEFASSMLADDSQGGGGGGGSGAASSSAAALKSSPLSSSSSKTAAYRRPAYSTATSSSLPASETWKRDLDELLNVSTSNSRRQALLQRLLNSNADIRKSVEKALKDRTIDPLLTPQTKRIQDGTRAVARQVTSDILPGLAQTAASRQQQGSSRRSPSSSSSTNDWFPAPPVPPPLNLASVEAAVADLSKVGDRLFNIAQRQFQRGLDDISRDLADPSRIPDRVAQQASELVRETLNVFAETPIDLKEPNYRIVMTTDDYEIRDYDTYRVASTRAASVDQGVGAGSSAVDSWAQDGAAFATLASYLFGGNQESQVLEMTTPVTTTMTGEMRVYLALEDDRDAPEPVVDSSTASASAVEIQTLPPARLAVRKFPGFVTDGEVGRQKQALLTALELDGIELDVRHGQTVPHVIFQYNPPYTVPVLRRNEIAVPVVGPSDQVEAELRNRDIMSTTNDEFWSDDA